MAVGRGGSLFFSVISIGRMIHVPSCSTSSECLHFLFVSPLFSPSRPRPLLSLIPPGVLSRARSRFPPPFSLFARRIQFLPSLARTHFQSSPPVSADIRRRRKRRGGYHSHIDFDARFNPLSPPPPSLPKEHSFASFQYHAFSLRFCPDALFESRDRENTSPYQSLPLDRGRKSRIISETVTV